MHLFIDADVEVCFDGNVVGVSVSDVPDGIHSILTANQKFLVFIDGKENHLPISENCRFVSLLSVVSCAYPEKSDWRDLTKFITKETFQRCLFVSKISEITEESNADDTSLTLDAFRIEIIEDMEFNFAIIPNDTPIQSSEDHTSSHIEKLSNSISKITLYALDKSHLNKFLNLSNILQELQLSFVLFSIYQSELSYETFKSHLYHLTHIQTKSNNQTLPLFIKLCKVLMGILKCFPIDFFRDPLSSGSFLEECLKNLYVNLEGERCVESLADLVESLFMWDMRLGFEDEQPTIVDE